MNRQRTGSEKTLLAAIILTLAGFTSLLAADGPGETQLYPSSGNDTAQLQAALDNCSGNTEDENTEDENTEDENTEDGNTEDGNTEDGNTEDGCVIRLAKGTFHTNTLVATNFRGKIFGAGQHDTIIRPIEGETLKISGIDPFFPQDPAVANPWPYLITFSEGDIKLSNLSFVFPDGPLNADPWFLCGGPYEGVLAGAVVVTGRDPVNFEVSEVSVTGGTAGPVFGGNVFNGIYYEGLLMREGAPAPDCGGDPYANVVNLSGKYSARHNTLTNVLTGLPIAALEDAKVSIEDNAFKTLLGVEVYDLLDSKLTITNNLMDVGAYGVLIGQNTGGSAYGNSSIVIRHNDIHVNRQGTSAFGVGIDAIEYFDYTAGATSEKRIDVAENWINLGVDVFDGVFLGGDEGALRIRENSFRGEAIYTGITVVDTDACRINNNDFTNFTAGVNIFLDSTTSNCNVTAAQGDVLDDGTGNKVIIKNEVN